MKRPTQKQLQKYIDKHHCNSHQAFNMYQRDHEKHKITCKLNRALSSKPGEMVAEITYRDDGELGGYFECNVEVTREKNGGLSISGTDLGDERFVYLYPSQVKFLKRFLSAPFKST